MDRAQRHKEATGSLCFLTNHAILEWNSLIQIAGLKSPGAKTRQDCITSLQTFSPLRGACERQIQPSSAGHLLRKGFNDTHVLVGHIDQHNLRDVKIFALLTK